jgi:ParB/RepB/Spo0J family partition protein
LEEDVFVRLDEIDAPKIQLRPVRKYSVDYFELVDSIKKDGILQPILIRKKEGRYVVVEGNWRYSAAKDAGLTEIPCLLREFTDDEVMIIQLKTQAIRPETLMVEYSDRINAIMDSKNTSLAELAVLINKSVAWVRKVMGLRKLISSAREMVDRDEITLCNAVALSKLPRELQPNFLTSAVTCRVIDFQDMTRKALRDWRMCSQQDRTRWSEYQAGNTVGYFRRWNELKEEVRTNLNAGLVLKRMEAKTPMEGWRACLAWLYHLDPASLEEQCVSNSMTANKPISYAQRRKDNRMLLETLTTEITNG